jgi:hypothetical protein
MDYGPLCSTPERGPLSPCVTRVAAHEAHRFGMVHAEDSGRIAASREAERTDAALANMGIYLFETAARTRCARPVEIVLDVLRPQVAAGHRVSRTSSKAIGGRGHGRVLLPRQPELVRPQPRLALHDARWPT